MTFDATFWVAVSFVIFFGALVYLKIPGKINELYAKLNPKVHTGTKFFSPFPNEKGCKENIYADAEEGDLLIFPAHLLHMAPSLYDTDELRVIFSFNFS